jgi:hypothetical protein
MAGHPMGVKKRLAAVGSALLLTASMAIAHHTETHANITSAAIQFLAYRGQYPLLAQNALTVEQLLRVGSIQEDLDPHNRFMFHFNPALNNTVFPDGSFYVWGDCSSTDWGFHDGQTCTHDLYYTYNPGTSESFVNENTWSAAVADAKSNDPAIRKRGWIRFGYVLHLLQDLTSPAHVRNDPHPPVLDPDPLESEIRTPSLPAGPIPTVPPDITLPNGSFYSGAQLYFSILQQTVQRGYFSKDTVIGASFPGPTIDHRDGVYLFDANNVPIAVEQETCISLEPPAPDVTVCTTLRTVDSTVASAQWTTLGPLAVLYTAGFIEYFIKSIGGDLMVPQVNPNVPGDCLQAKIGITAVQSRGSNDPFNGLNIGDTVVATFNLDQSMTWLETFTDKETLSLHYPGNSSVSVQMPDRRRVTSTDAGIGWEHDHSTTYIGAIGTFGPPDVDLAGVELEVNQGSFGFPDLSVPLSATAQQFVGGAASLSAFGAYSAQGNILAAAQCGLNFLLP